MPFSKTTEKHTEEYWTKHFEHFLKPTIEECPELEALRSEPLRGDVLKQIITNIVNCPVVVADLTDWNPNVFWELGVRQSFKHGTITIAEKGTKMPFDVSIKSCLFYNLNDYIENEKFRKRFKKAINDSLSNPDKSDSHVLETVSGRGTLFEIIHRDEAIRRVKALISECKHNTAVINEIYEIAKKNQKTPAKRIFVTSRFRFSAIELLVTNRYLDEKDNFYKMAEDVIDNILTRTDQLNIWENSPTLTEAWFIDDEKQNEFEAEGIKFMKKLRKTQRKLELSC